MAEKKKFRVAVLYGGGSGEDEGSLQSAASVIRHLDPKRFEGIPIAIDKQGKWHLNDLSRVVEVGSKSKSLPVFKDAPQIVLPPNPADGQTNLMPLRADSAESRPFAGTAVDVVFPVMHGPLCEDGTI